jgi:hypothetical protein
MVRFIGKEQSPNFYEICKRPLASPEAVVESSNGLPKTKVELVLKESLIILMKSMGLQVIGQLKIEFIH